MLTETVLIHLESLDFLTRRANMRFGRPGSKHYWLVVWYCGTRQDKRYETCSIVRTKVAKNPRPEIREIIKEYAHDQFGLPRTEDVNIDVVKTFNPSLGTVCATVTL